MTLPDQDAPVRSDAMRESFRRLRYAVMANQAQVWEWRVSEGRVFRTDFAPSDAAQDASRPRGQTLATWLNRIHPEDVVAVEETLNACRTGESERIRVQYRMQVGSSYRWFEVVGIVSYRRDNGELVQMLGTETDVTESKRVLQLLSAAQKRAEEANRAKSDFLANMSHEVRTPLNAVIGLARLLRKTQLDEPQTKYLDMIDSSAKALLAVLNDVLDLSKIEAGRLTLDSVEFDLRDWLEDAVMPYMSQVHGKGLAFDLIVAADVPHVIEGDPGRLRQIIANLVSNAVRFTSAGSITVEVTRLSDDFAHTDAPDGARRVGLNFAVRDTGIGIPPDAVEKIFQAFEQADASTTRRYGGTGLGLAICQRLAAMFGSTIRVTSTMGQGSTFEMQAEFKVVKDPSRALTQPSSWLNTTLTGLKVLVAEDNPINQLLVRQMLDEMRLNATLVNNGHEAVDAWQQGGYDLVLMDIQMPVMSGEEAVGRIRALESERGTRTPIVAMTAHALTGDRERYLSLGMDGYVSKPMSPESLLLGIQEALVRSQETGPAIDRISLNFDTRYDTTFDPSLLASVSSES